MNRPEKKICKCKGKQTIKDWCVCGARTHNSACNKWENFLPSADEIQDLICDYIDYGVTATAEAIAKRMGGD